MTFQPRWTFTPRIQRQINAIERTVGFLEHIRLRPEWTADLHRQSRVQDALSSVQIEGNRLTPEAAFELAHARPESVALNDDELEFLNYLDTFNQR
jgi:hypothetical protein